MSQLPQPVELPEQTRRIRGGVLATALPAPDGWQRGGLAVPWYGCGEPILRDKCIAGEDEAHRPVVATYPVFPIEQGSTCSTLSQLDHEAFARGRLDATTEWALGRQLATDIVGTGAPSLEDAQLLGTLPGPEDVVWAVACLEQAAADTGYGTEWWLHTSPRGAAYARRYHMMDGQGLSPSGARWIVSPGYPSTGEEADQVRFWVTGPVWAAVDAPDVHAAVDWRGNEDPAWALRAGVVAFDPCINFAYDVTVGACGTPTPPVDTETLSFDWEAVYGGGGGAGYIDINVVSGTLPAGDYVLGGEGWSIFDEETEQILFPPTTKSVSEDQTAGYVLVPLATPNSLGQAFTVDVDGPYEIQIDVNVPEGVPRDGTVIDSGTVTYTRPVTP